MGGFLRIGLVVCLAVASATPALAQQDDDTIATATALLDQLEVGDFEGATAGFNAQMKTALGPDELEGVQRQIEAAGDVISRDPPRVSQQDGYTVVVVRVRRQHAAFDATVAIDVAGSVAGLHFAPASDGP